MPDYRVKISETTDGDLEHHHYLVNAKDETEAKKSAMKFMEHFIDDDNDPEIIENGYTLIPFFRGISVDLNLTFALALIAVFMIQVVGFRAQGFGYFSKFFINIIIQPP